MNTPVGSNLMIFAHSTMYLFIASQPLGLMAVHMVPTSWNPEAHSQTPCFVSSSIFSYCPAVPVLHAIQLEGHPTHIVQSEDVQAAQSPF
jgi:hypothetical protein